MTCSSTKLVQGLLVRGLDSYSKMRVDTLQQMIAMMMGRIQRRLLVRRLTGHGRERQEILRQEVTMVMVMGLCKEELIFERLLVKLLVI